jgi:hypothetical protein
MSSGDSLKEAGLEQTDVEDMPTMDEEKSSQEVSTMETSSPESQQEMLQSEEGEVEPEAEVEVEPEVEPEAEVEGEVEPEVEPEVEGEVEPEVEDEMEKESVSKTPSGEKVLSVLNKATNFRKKLTTTKRKLPSLDDEQKDKIRNELIHEYTNILKLYKNKTTRKKYIRRLNGLRTVFNQSLNKLNGTTRQRKRKTRVKKVKADEEMSQMPSSQYEEESPQMPPSEM